MSAQHKMPLTPCIIMTCSKLQNAETTEVEVEEAIVDEPPAEADESPAPTVEVINSSNYLIGFSNLFDP